MSGEYVICVIHYGSSALTHACLESTIDLDHPPAATFVVDNSGGETPELELPRTLSERITMIAPRTNLGFGGGANLGFEVIQRERPVEFVLLLNNDARLLPGSVPRLLAAALNDRSVAMVGPRLVRRSDGRIWHDGGRIHWPEGSIESIRYDEPEPEQALPPYETDFICGCAPLIRITAFQSVGGFDERFFLYYEDADLSLRLSDRGWRLLHDPIARVEHIGSATIGERPELARYYQVRNRYFFHLQHAPKTRAADRARSALLRRARWRALRCLLTGRLATARALASAERDYRCGRRGKR